MSVLTNHPPVQWVTASPLWATASADPSAMQRPALLRFQGDTFMQDLVTLVQTAPRQLAAQVARPESFRARPAGADPTWQPLPPNPQLKLFQPVHGYFYLVAASLVCRLPGLPDRTVNIPTGEKVQFVLRRFDGTNEMAWVAAAGGKLWQVMPPAQAGAVAQGEDLLPLFPVRFPDGDRTRGLYVGLVPTSSRETYQAAPAVAPADAAGEDGRLDEFNGRVLGAIQALQAMALLPSQPPSPGVSSDTEQTASMFLLLDFADFLRNQQINVLGPTPPGPGDAAYDLYTLLNNTPATDSASWLQALNDAWAQRNVINGEQTGTLDPVYNLKNNHLTGLDTGALKNAVVKALGPYQPPLTPPGPVSLPKLDPAGGDLYVLRCVYRRPACRPPHPDVVSPPTVPFALAQFFDPDAPSRPIRIPLPTDTSIAGLRKFAKNVAFLTSGGLRNQVSSVTDLKQLIAGATTPGDSTTLGEICSFSLPIITICAMIVLIIFIILLNIAFWWLPFFRLCFPIPQKK